MYKALLLALSAVYLTVTSAFAAVSPGPAKVFVASTGNDANDGGRATPKRSFQAAHDAVAAGGEIVVLDTAGYGTVTITKSVGIIVPPGVNGFVTASSGNGITINAGSSAVVTLRGLFVEGTGPSGGNAGIYATSVGTLIIEDTTVRAFNEGIQFRAAAGQLIVRRGAVRETNFGIDIADSQTFSVVSGNVSDIEMTSNVNSFYVGKFNTGSDVVLAVTRCNVTITTPTSFAFRAYYIGAAIIVDGCTIMGANKARQVVFKIDGSDGNKGLIYTRGNNMLGTNVSAYDVQDGPPRTLNPE